MSDTQASGLSPVQWIAARAALDEESALFAEASGSPAALVTALVAAGKHPEAVRCVAGAMPPREGIWWAFVSARHTAQVVHGGALPPLLRMTLDAVDKWIQTPDDRARRAAWAAGDALGTGTPAGAAAAAVFLSGGSIAPPDAPHMPPPPGLTGSLVSTAVVLAAVTAPPEAITEYYTAYLKQGLAVIDQLGGWDAAIAATWRVLEAQQREQAQVTSPTGAPAGAPA